MKHALRMLLAVSLGSLLLAACSPAEDPDAVDESTATAAVLTNDYVAERADIYAAVELTVDLSGLSAGQRQAIGYLVDASEIMDDLFWRQAYGGKQAFLSGIENDEERHFAEINYGPWDRLNNETLFVDGYTDKPLGAQFYPADMTREEFDSWNNPDKAGLYSFVIRDADGGLALFPFHEAFANELAEAAKLLRDAMPLVENEAFRDYLGMRADALVSGEFQASDFAWMDMKDNSLEMVIGPIETYEDRLFGYRAAYESYVLLKDMAWSERLSRFADFLPELQRGLPVPDQYKQETPGTDSDLNAYDVLYYAGRSNAGSKTIAINLPNDEQVQLQKGTRRLQLKNAIRAKFDRILVPIADLLIAEDQRQYITFNAFFSNTMFHEVAHGLGIKNTLDGSGTVRAALKEHASALEEGKADILGLYMITRLFEKGEMNEGKLMDHYVTFMASVFRSVRFGASSAHGRANMIRFNFFQSADAFTRDETTGTYHVDFEKMQDAMSQLSGMILTLQGDGDYEGVDMLVQSEGTIGEQLQTDLDRLAAVGIPVDIEFIQGKDVLGL